jgi:hypothetical protein
MSTRQSNPRAAPRLHTAVDRGLVALGALVAVGVMVLFLALARANRANPANSETWNGIIGHQSGYGPRPVGGR